MDRFIEYSNTAIFKIYKYLKSNMDRFIEGDRNMANVKKIVFKIQYG